MKNYIVEKKMTNNTDGYYTVVIEGETHLNKLVLTSQIQFFTTEVGYDYNHPWQVAKQIAQAIANGLNELELIRFDQKRMIVDHPNFRA